MEAQIKLAGNISTEKKKKFKLRLSGRTRQSITGYLFLAPFLILFIIFVILPVLQAARLSLTYYNLLQPPRYLGLTNFRNLLTDDDVFLIALKNTFVFACVVGPTGYALSFLFAWLINQFKFKTGFALAFYAPSITSGIALQNVWLYFFSGDRYGFINNILIKLGAIQQPIQWLADQAYLLKVIMFIQLWMSMGTGFLVFLAGLQNVPSELYEAGAIDGISSRFQELWHITLPSMKPQLLFGAVNSIVGSFGVFDITLIAGMPSPNYAAHTIVAHLFDKAFIRFEMGYAAAIAVVLFVITFALGRLVMKLLSSKGEM